MLEAHSSSILKDSIRRGLNYIVMINKLPEENIFKICAEFWHLFTSKVVKSKQSSHGMKSAPLLMFDSS